jgi:hypothetical protein
MPQPRLALCTLAVFALSHSAFAQQPSQKVTGPPKDSVAVSNSESDPVAQQHKIAVQRVSAFADHVLAFNKVEVKAWALARLADLLWKEDEPYARQLFSKSLDVCAPKSGSTPTEIQTAGLIRRDIIDVIATRDANWAKRLIDANSTAYGNDEARASARMDANFSTAYDLLKSEPGKSVDFAERSLRDGVPPGMTSLLIMLRLKDEKAANALFLKTLDQLLAQPIVSADTLLSLGTYIFTSPEFDPQDTSIAPDMTRLVGVGRILVYDITADRPNIPREIVHAYLEVAAKILTRQIPVTSRPSYYAAARLLLPKTAKFAPELTQTIAVVMQSLIADVPPDITLDSAYANFEVAAAKELSETIKDIEKEKNEQRRDERYFVLLADLWRRADFVGARALNAKISDTDVQSELATLIDFKEAANKLERRQGVGAAEEIARKLPKGIERAMLWLGIARARAKAGEAQRAIEALNAALESASNLRDARRPYLTLTAASQLAQLDPMRAQSTLAEAIRQFNAQTSESLIAVSWEQRVETGRMWRYFPLKVAGVESEFRQTLPSLMKADAEGTVESVKQLTDERQLAIALIAVATAMLA